MPTAASIRKSSGNTMSITPPRRCRNNVEPLFRCPHTAETVRPNRNVIGLPFPQKRRQHSKHYTSAPLSEHRTAVPQTSAQECIHSPARLKHPAPHGTSSVCRSIRNGSGTTSILPSRRFRNAEPPSPRFAQLREEYTPPRMTETVRPNRNVIGLPFPQKRRQHSKHYTSAPLS